jgi:hypothetical protein
MEPRWCHGSKMRAIRRGATVRRHGGDHQQIMDTITIGIEAGMTAPSAAYYSPWLVPGIIRPLS